MHKYETVLVFQADLDEAALNTAVETVETLIKNNGEVTKIDRWGKRKLAYPIRKQFEGYYVYMTFDGAPSEIANIKRSLGYNEQILRYIIVRVD
ncbi:MAG: 30S ribosomal protein S6 [Chloroflexi bacterium]|jgi:small subunit ribosomal protein S6|nr:30S ribosomal protein S6 [Chloroflexota bacterium]